LNLCNWVLGRLHRDADRWRPNSGEGLTGGKGKVGEKVQRLTAVTGVAGVGEERDQGGVSTVNRGGRWCSKGRRRRSGGRRAGGVAEPT
jgi:hypothetical protein